MNIKSFKGKLDTFNECHSSCKCNKKKCGNFLVNGGSHPKPRLLIKRVKKECNKSNLIKTRGQEPVLMWGLFTMDYIPKGSFVSEYCGEIISTKQADARGTYYDKKGLSYLFSMNQLTEEETQALRESKVFKYFNKQN